MSGGEVFNPLTLQVTVFPPGGGAPMILNQIISEYRGLYFEIPFYNDQQYSYNLKITDACGNVYTKNNNIINEKFNVEVKPETEGCGGNLFSLKPTLFIPPYTVTFINAPDDFDPVASNPAHPTFIGNTTYGFLDFYVPEGDYTIQVTDACGRTVTVDFIVETNPVAPEINGQSATCTDGGAIGISVDGKEIVYVEMLSAPAEYPGPFPKDVSIYIVDGEFEITDLPPGLYTFFVIDSCGDEYELEYEVLLADNNTTLSASQRPGCDPGYGSIRINNAGEDLSILTITAAPPEFTEPLPFDASSYIANDGRAYMNSLPEGSYTFSSVNSCGGTVTRTVSLSGYAVTTNDFTIVPHCGSFDIQFQHVSNGTYIQGFYLQKYNPVDGVWEHPQTGIDYVEGGQANTSNSISLINNGINNGYPYTGEFRILKTFFVYDNGSIANIRCFQVLHTFTFDDGPVIIDAYSFPCESGLTEVAVIAQGVPPLTYGITTKNGAPFVVNNGESNLFTGLESAIYNFNVTDVCGNIRNILLDIDALDPIAIQANDFCDGEDSSLSVPQFTFLTYKWYKEGAPQTVLSTTSMLNFPAYNSATDAATYYVSIMSDNPLSCMNQELSFSLEENTIPNAGSDITVPFCNDGIAINLKNYLDEGIITTGDWEDTDNTGLLNNSTLTTAGLAEGTYQFKYTITGLCNLTDEAILTLQVKTIPAAPVVNSNTPICENSEIQLSATDVPGATYLWTGPNGFSSTELNPVLSDVTLAASGTYTLVVSVNDCSSPEGSINITVEDAAKAGDDNTIQFVMKGMPLILKIILLTLQIQEEHWEDIDATGALTDSSFATEGITEGSYQFRYTVSNICNITDEAIITIQLTDIPQPPTVSPIDPVCEGSDVQLTASEIANASYEWVGPNGFTSTDHNPLLANVNTNASGVYTLSVTVNNCTSDVVNIPLTVNALPQFTVQGNTVLCEGQTSVLSVMPENFDGTSVDYKWYLDGSELAETTSSIQISELGNYEVIVDNSHCTTIREIEVTLNDNPFDLVLDSGCVNYEYMLWVANITDISGAVVNWTGPGGFSFTGNEANITNLAEGDYTATVTNSEGCTADATITIYNTSCIIPRGISPNGDGMNDTFDLSNLDVKEIKIFNRYGLKVYEAQNYLDEWHGQSDKGTLPTGTYYYVITLSAGKQVTGWVYLQREE